jgi:hypothetical protein
MKVGRDPHGSRDDLLKGRRRKMHLQRRNRPFAVLPIKTDNAFLKKQRKRLEFYRTGRLAEGKT